MLCRLSLAAAVGGDWPATAAHADSALECLQGLVEGIGGEGGGGSSARGGRGFKGDGEGVGEATALRSGGIGCGGCGGTADGRESGRKRGRGDRDEGSGGGGGGGSSGWCGGSSPEKAPGDCLQAAAVSCCCSGEGVGSVFLNPRLFSCSPAL